MESCLPCLLAVDLKIYVEDSVMLTRYSTLLRTDCIGNMPLGCFTSKRSSMVLPEPGSQHPLPSKGDHLSKSLSPQMGSDIPLRLPNSM